MKAVPESPLPLYNEDEVATLQRFFGLELASKTAANGNCGDHDSTASTSDRVDDKDRGTTYFHLKQRVTPAEQADDCSDAPADTTAPDTLAERARYRVRNWFWYGLFSFGAMLGDDFFYFFMFTFSMANFSWWITRRLLMVWGFCMFIGQASKEILQWPRPREPPVVRLERRYSREYGMPSTHAVVGTLMPFTLLVSTWNNYEYPHILGFVLACNWTLLVCCSRLYRGMHFILDLLAGVSLTVLLMALIWPWLDTVDHFSQTHPYAPLVVVTATILLIVLYPTPDGIGDSRNDTVSILGTMAGGLCAFWCNNQSGLIPYVRPQLGGLIKWPDLPTATCMFARYMVVKVAVIIMFFGGKFLLKRLIPALSGIQVNDKTKKWLRVQLAYGYIPHFSTMLVAYQLGPLVWKYLGVD